jgi:hypothetical protein
MAFLFILVNIKYTAGQELTVIKLATKTGRRTKQDSLKKRKDLSLS